MTLIRQGMKKGESKAFTIPSAEAYGNHRKELVFNVPKDKVPEGSKVGQFLQTQDESGQMFSLTIVELKDKDALLDGNHPLAGKDLIFEVTVVEIAS